MTDRDRLEKLYEKATEEYAKTNKALFRKTFICDYLLANGVIVPPCKVGDKVYFIDTCTTAEDFGKKYVSWGEVLQLTFNCFGKWVLLTDKRLLDMDENIFLTKEEAEEKLKELGK